MRTVVCTKVGNAIFKIAWVNEDRQGVYVGMYGEVAGTHFSYHSDGTRHTKFAGRGALPLNQFRGTPIQDIDPFVQIMTQALNLRAGNPGITVSEYKHDNKATTEVLLPSSIFESSGQIGVSFYLVRKGKELQFMTAMTNPIMETLALTMAELNNFPELKCAIQFYGGTKIDAQQIAPADPREPPMADAGG